MVVEKLKKNTFFLVVSKKEMQYSVFGHQVSDFKSLFVSCVIVTLSTNSQFSYLDV